MLRSLLSCLVFVTLLPVAAVAGPKAGRAGAWQAAPIPVRSPSPDLVLTNLAGQRVSLRDLLGKVVVLNFWATWCKPCVEEMPLLAEVASRYRDRDVVVVAASVDEPDSRPLVEAFAEALGEDVQVWIGAGLVDMGKMQLGSSLPATAVLDRKGVIVVTKGGSLQRGSLDAALDALLGPKERKKKPTGGAVEAWAPVPSPTQPGIQAAGPSL